MIKMKTKEDIVKNWLPRYTGEALENFGKYILLTNFSNYVRMFADWNNVTVVGADKPMQCATADGITIVNFGMGSPTAATVMDLLTAIDPEAVLFVGWADSYVRDGEEFRRALLAAADVACETAGVIVGVRPTYPATGYGYIHAGAALEGSDGAYLIAGFEEKPDEARARAFVADGSYLWNPGMSVWVASRLLELIRLHKPAHHEALLKIEPHLGTPREREAMEEAFAGLDREPIDTAVFEKAEGLATVVTDPGWSDVGTWAAVYELGGTEASDPSEVGDAARGANVSRGEVVALDTEGCLIHAAGGRPVFTLGVSDLVIVDAGDCLLVARRDQAERLKELHTLAKQSGHTGLL
jgi:mannose-1-phosphate guanylyltransferase